MHRPTVSDTPSLLDEWHNLVNSNFGMDPSRTTLGSKKRAAWICSKGHTWYARVAHRSNGSGCPFCSGRKPIVGTTDLSTTHPSLAAQWDHSKNKLNLTEVSVSSSRKAHWRCSKGHSWESTVAHRTRGDGCPFCSGKQVLTGYNDLGTLNPSLASEWDIKKNSLLTPQQVTVSSNKKVHWLCSEKHSWMAVIANRTSGTGCPKCRPDSKPEVLLREALQGAKMRVPITGTYHKAKEVDVYLHHMKTVVEYDGWYYHHGDTQETHDIRMTIALLSSGHKVIRVREKDTQISRSLDYLPPLKGLRQISFNPNTGNYENLAREILKLINEMEDPDER